MPCKDVMTSSIASRRGEGVMPVPPGDGGIGDAPLDIVGYLSFIDGAGEGVRAARDAL